MALGAGYSHASLEDKAASTVFTDSFNEWNVGLNVGYDAFGVGVAYLKTNNGLDNFDTKAWVAGADYVTGPYKFGLNYLNGTQEAGVGVHDISVDRWTVGTVYEWGPGMTFRGAVQWQKADDGTDDASGTQVTLGTQLNF